MKLKLTFLALTLLFSVTEALAQQQARQFVIVSIAGNGYSLANPNDFYSSTLGRSHPTGPWTYLYRGAYNQKIAAKIYLEHGAGEDLLQKVIKLFESPEGCRDDLGLIVLANSWGVGNMAKLAKMYNEQCKRKIELAVVVDGVSKPIPLPYKKEIPSQVCVNYYQVEGPFRGDALPNCENHLYTYNAKSLRQTHIAIEYQGSEAGVRFIYDYLWKQN
jgi:hypothetical protein